VVSYMWWNDLLVLFMEGLISFLVLWAYHIFETFPYATPFGEF